MPIKPENKIRYSSEWATISASIRFIRAKCQCEWVENGERCKAMHGMPHPITGSKVVLTVMHLDHNPENNEYGNLLAACQLHHNRYDAKHRAETRRAGRIKKTKITIKNNGARSRAEKGEKS